MKKILLIILLSIFSYANQWTIGLGIDFTKPAGCDNDIGYLFFAKTPIDNHIDGKLSLNSGAIVYKDKEYSKLSFSAEMIDYVYMKNLENRLFLSIGSGFMRSSEINREYGNSSLFSLGAGISLELEKYELEFNLKDTYEIRNELNNIGLGIEIGYTFGKRKLFDKIFLDNKNYIEENNEENNKESEKEQQTEEKKDADANEEVSNIENESENKDKTESIEDIENENKKNNLENEKNKNLENSQNEKQLKKTNPNLDKDHDGVEDIYDVCPNTPEGAVVDEYGCREGM